MIWSLQYVGGLLHVEPQLPDPCQGVLVSARRWSLIIPGHVVLPCSRYCILTLTPHRAERLCRDEYKSDNVGLGHAIASRRPAKEYKAVQSGNPGQGEWDGSDDPFGEAGPEVHARAKSRRGRLFRSGRPWPRMQAPAANLLDVRWGTRRVFLGCSRGQADERRMPISVARTTSSVVAG
jgi:hypothetical protein